jgi:hypothetical protein
LLRLEFAFVFFEALFGSFLEKFNGLFAGLMVVIVFVTARRIRDGVFVVVAVAVRYVKGFACLFELGLYV